MLSTKTLLNRVRGFAPALFAVAALLTSASAAFAQVSVTATAGTTTASYATLGAAFSAINLGTHQGVIGITITGTTSEVATSAVLNASGSGAASYSALTIAPGAGIAGAITGGVAGALLDLNGASHVTIDGLNSGGSSLRIENTATGTTAATVRLINGASSNTIQNCTVNGAGTATTTGVVVFAGTTGASGNSSNVVNACDIGPSGANLPMVGVYSSGTTTSTAVYNSLNTLSNNRIHDTFSTTAAASVYGVELLTGNTDWTIAGNSVYQAATRTPVTTGTMYGIYVVNATNGNNFVISGNFVGGTAASAGGTALTVNAGTNAYTFIGIYAGSTTVGVQGNTITNFAWTSGGNPMWRGIYGTTAFGTTVNIGTVTGNTIGAGTGTGAITLSSTALSSAPGYGIDFGGTGTVNVANNTIGGITGSGTWVSFTGVNSAVGASGTGTGSIGNNLVGSLTTAGSISMTTATASAGQITGINLTGTPASGTPIAVTGNTIANLASAAVTANLRSVHGIEMNTVGTTAYTITGNTIRNLSSAATGTSIAPLSAPIVGIAISQMTSGTLTLSQNTIYSLASTSATGSALVEGIGVTMSTVANTSGFVTRNLVHSLTAVSSAACTIVGIAPVQHGLMRYANNMVRLGVDAGGSPVTGPYTFVGIGTDAGAAWNSYSGGSFYFNTVWIGGSVASGSANSYAFYRANASFQDTLKDNIFANVRTGGTGKHFAFSVNTALNKSVDYNLYWSGGSANVVSLDNLTPISTLQAIRNTTAGWDAHSGLGDPQLVAPAAATAGLNLKLQPFTPAEGSGAPVAITGQTDIDQEGDVRAANTPSDIGADAGLYAVSAATDAFPPVITVTPLTNTSSTGDRTLSAAITDLGPVGGGVPTSGSFVPRVWFRKVGTLPWFSAPGTLAGGSGTSGTWNFTVSGATMGLASGDFAEYYVVAQDQASTPNLWYSPVTAAAPIHTDVNTQVTAAATTLSYQVIGTYAGTYYVPNDPGGQAPHTFATLTAASGLFAAINGGTLSGNVTVVVNGDVATETGANALNPWIEDGAGGWTFAIQPDGAALRTVSGTVATAGAPLINFNGADRVTIDGSFGGSGQYLRFRNTNATATSCGPTIQFNNGATFGALKNSIVESNATTTTTGEVLIGATGANNNFTISGNDLRDATGGTPGSPANAIYGNSASISNVAVTNNTIHNFGNFGVDFGGTTYNAAQAVGSGITVSGNSFYFDGTTAGAYQCAIGIGGAGDGHVVSGNFIGGKAPSCGGAAWSPATSATVYGIGVSASGATTGTSIQGNTIQNWAINTSLTTFYGIATTNGKFSIGTVSGNVVGHASTAGSISLTSTAAATVYGISASGVSVDAQNNLVANLAGTGLNPYLRGLLISSTGAATCQNNTVRNATLPGTSANASYGISVTGTGPFDVGGTTGNTVSNLGLAVTALSYGLGVTSTSLTGNVVSHNSVTGIASSGTGAWYGISIASPYNASSSTIQGNTVQGVTSAGTEFRGLSAAGNPGATNGFGPASMTGNLVGHDTTPGSITVSGPGASTGIWLEGYSNSFSGLDDLSNSTIANLTASGTGTGVSLRGIYVAQASTSVSGGYVGMSNVSIHDLQSASTSTGDGATAPAVVGIWLLGAQAPYVQGCTIHGLRGTTSAAAATAVDGIWATGGIGTIQRNRIWDLTNTSTSASALIRGVYQFGGTWTLANNEIALTNGANTNSMQMQGIAQNLVSGIGSANIDYNSVYVGGSQASGASASHACLRQAGFVDVLADNLFLNARSNTGSSTGSHYALGSTLAGGWTSNYNVLVAPAAAKLAQWAGTDATLATWQAASAGDGNSLGETAANVPVAQLFSDPGNGVLDIKPTATFDIPPIVSNAGAPVAGIGSDIGGVDARSATTPDVGADEITVSRALTTAGALPPASPAYPGNYDDLTVSGAGAPTLSGNINVFGALTLGGGNLTTGARSVTISPSGSVVRTSGSVVGTLRKYFPVSASSAMNFEVGSGGDYAYVRVTLAPVTTAGYVSATTAGAEHALIASSLIDPAHDANRYWTLAGSGVSFGTAAVTAHFVPTDLDAGADPATFQASRYDGSAWSLPAAGSRTSTSTQVTGLTSLGDIAVGTGLPRTITATSGSGGGVSPAGAASVPYASSTSYTITPTAHYHVADVLVDGVSVGAVTSYAFTNVVANHTISATFALDTNPIVASSGANGFVTPAGTTNVGYALSQAYTITPASHYHVADVLVDGASVGAVTSYAFTNVTAGHTISATFAIDTYTIVASSGANGSMTPAGTTQVPYGGSQVYAIAGNTGYHVADVLVDGSSVGAVTTYTFTSVTVATHTISATFALDTYVLTASSGTNGSVTPAGTTNVSYGGSQTYAITAEAHYHVADVLVDGASVGAVTSYTFTNVVANHTISATFALDTNPIVASSGANGFVTPAGTTNVGYALSQAYTITPASHYHVADVLVDGASVGAVTSYAFTNVTAGHTISATFAIDTNPIVASSGANGSMTPAGTTQVPYGGSQVYAIAGNTGYHVADVLVDGSSVGAVTTYTFTSVTVATHTISATFAINSYTLSASATAGGSISPPGVTTLDWNGSQAYTMTADPGYLLVALLVDGASVGAPATYTFSSVAANHTISAQYELIMNPAPVSAGSPTGTLSSTTASLTVPVTLSRNYANAMRLFHVTLQLSPELTLAGGTGGITAGGFLASGGDPTTFQVVDNGGGSYSVDGSVLGTSCNVTALSGTLFNVAVSSSVTTGPGSVTITDVTLRDCDNATLPGATGSAASVAIDNGVPSVSLTSPVGGEFLVAASPQTITWSATDNVGVTGIDLALSLDGGATWPTAIATGIPNTGSHAWTVPTSLSTTARVRATAHDAAGNSAISGSAADFTIGQYTVTLTGGSGGSISPNTLQSVNHGSDLAFTVAANAGYHIASVLDGATELGTGGSYTLTNVTANHTITASFAINQYTVTLTAGSGGSISPSTPQTVNHGSDLAFTVAANAGYHIVSVLDGATELGTSGSYTLANLTANHTVTASFAIDQYTVTLTAGTGGSINPSTPQTVNNGSDLAFTVAANAGYHIVSVLDGATELGTSGSYTLTSVTANHTVTASFAINQYTVSLSAGTGGSINPSTPQTVNHGSDLAFTVTADAGYHIVSVLDGATDLGTSGSYTLANVTANHTITASFAINQYTVTLAAGTGGSINPSTPQTVNHGSDLAFTVTADAGYHIVSVLDGATDLGTSGSYTLANVTANHTITASFAINQYTVTLAAGTGGSISPNTPQTVNHGSNLSFTVTANAGYHIVSVLDGATELGTGGSYTLIGVTSNHTVTASFAINQYTVSLSAGTGGSISPSTPQTVNHGSDFSFTVTADPGYHVTSVLDGATELGAGGSYTLHNVTANHTVSASFAINQYIVTLTAGTGGTINPNTPQTVNHGGNLSFTVTADAGYHIASVLDGATDLGTGGSYALTGVIANHTVAATFAINQYTITVSAGAHGSISPAGPVTLNHGGSQAFTITPDAGYHVGTLNVDGGAQGVAPGAMTYSFTSVTANHTITATFDPNPAVPAITTLAATPLRSGNIPGNTTKIPVTWSGVASGTTVDVYRAPFGNYPLYAAGASPGAVPAIPASYPPAGWTLTAVHHSGEMDLPATRDFYYYVAYVTDAYGTVSPVSNRTVGTLDYPLGDVSNGATVGVGDAHVNIVDLSLLGGHYGATGIGATTWKYLDVGPTTDLSVNSMPTADGKLNFEDLAMFAINFEAVSAPQDATGPVAAAADELSFEAPGQVSRGDVVTLQLRLSGTGSVHALSAALGWDSEIVAPAGFEAGSMIVSQGGAMLSATPGSVDGVVLGADRRGFLGEDEFATIRFTALRDGAPGFTFSSVDARNGVNAKIGIGTASRVTAHVPLVTSLFAPSPNPAQGIATVAFGLSRSGAVDLALYSVDGRRVRTLAHGPHAANTYRVAWDGRDEQGRKVAAGVYYARLTTAQGTYTRSVVILQ